MLFLLKVDDPAAVFKEIDYDNGGKILFDEFAHWAIKNELDLDDDDDAESGGAGSGLIKRRPAITKKKNASSQKKVASKQADAPKKVRLDITMNELKSKNGCLFCFTTTADVLIFIG